MINVRNAVLLVAVALVAASLRPKPAATSTLGWGETGLGDRDLKKASPVRFLLDLDHNETDHDDEDHDVFHDDDDHDHNETDPHSDDYDHDHNETDPHDDDVLDHHDDDHSGHGHDDDDHSGHGHDDDDHSGHGHDDDDHDGHAHELGHDDDKPWGEVILASFLINIVTLIGVFILAGEHIAVALFNRDITNSPHYAKFSHIAAPSFACGALLATTLFLIMPESIAMITSHVTGGEGGAHAHRYLEEADDEEVHSDAPIAWRFGVSALGGFMIPLVSAVFFPHEHDVQEEAPGTTNALAAADVAEEEAEEAEKTGKAETEDSVATSDVKDEEGGDQPHKTPMDDNDKALTAADEEESGNVASPDAYDGPKNYTLAASILLGDFFHNFTDGVLIGTAFLLCSRDLAITIAAATVYHELAQEVADYILLTKHCNIRPAVALLLNFLCGLSILFGSCLMLAVDVSSNATGCILAIGGGVYIYIAVAECLPRAKAAERSKRDQLLGILCFLVGVFPIGLVLIDHGHCDAGHTDH